MKPTKLWEKWKGDPLFKKIVRRYPDRDYEYQFQLMCDYWLNERGRLPRTITAWDNWLRRTNPDPTVVVAREQNQRQRERREQMKDAPPINPEALEKLRKLKEGMLK